MADIQVRASAGVVATAESGRVVVLDDGTRLVPLWPSTVVSDGDRVQVVVVDGTAHIIGPVAASPRPVSGTIAGAASSGTIPVTTDVGTVRARYAGTAPSIGTLVGLIWQGTTAMLLPGTLAPVAGDPQPVPDPPSPPPPAPQSGRLPVTAQGSGSWRTGGWGWASSSDVVQGGAPFVSQDSRGGWWYGDAPAAIRGRTVTRFRIRPGARARLGYYNDPGTLHLYLTTDRARPAGDFSRVQGPVDVALPAGWQPDQIDLPAIWGQTLVDSGGGIGIYGSPYLGLAGVGSDPSSGQLTLDWTR